MFDYIIFINVSSRKIYFTGRSKKNSVAQVVILSSCQSSSRPLLDILFQLLISCTTCYAHIHSIISSTSVVSFDSFLCYSQLFYSSFLMQVLKLTFWSVYIFTVLIISVSKTIRLRYTHLSIISMFTLPTCICSLDAKFLQHIFSLYWLSDIRTVLTTNLSWLRYSFSINSYSFSFSGNYLKIMCVANYYLLIFLFVGSDPVFIGCYAKLSTTTSRLLESVFLAYLPISVFFKLFSCSYFL